VIDPAQKTRDLIVALSRIAMSAGRSSTAPHFPLGLNALTRQRATGGGDRHHIHEVLDAECGIRAMQDRHSEPRWRFLEAGQLEPNSDATLSAYATCPAGGRSRDRPGRELQASEVRSDEIRRLGRIHPRDRSSLPSIHPPPIHHAHLTLPPSLSAAPVEYDDDAEFLELVAEDLVEVALRMLNHEQPAWPMPAFRAHAASSAVTSIMHRTIHRGLRCRRRPATTGSQRMTST
jgi:hypothetical protein